ncbi:MAG: hypothetical protein SGPRY_009857, partial [Prymnesium sp.]
GGGVGGLALALALEQRGMKVAVFERDSSFFARSQGYGFTLQQGGAAVRSLGLAEAVEAAGCFCSRHVSLDSRGRLLGLHGGRKPQAHGPAARRNVLLPRQSLRALLYSRLKRGTVRWGCELTSLSSSGDHLQLQLHARRPVRAHVVVGADGIRSRVSEAAWGGGGGGEVDIGGRAALQPVGVMVVLGFTQCEHPLCSSDAVFELLDGQTRFYGMPFFPSPCRTTMWQLSFSFGLAEAHALTRGGGPALLDEARRRCAGWAAPVGDLLRHTAACDVSGYPLYDKPMGESRFTPLTGPISGLCTLVGDSAHPMAPFKGQGANQALLDALALGRALYSSVLGEAAASDNARRASDAELAVRRPRRRCGRGVREVLSEYEREACRRAAVKVRSSREAALLLHSPAALAKASGSLTRSAAARRALNTEDL